MRRVQAFEINEQKILPNVLRRAVTDYLDTVHCLLKLSNYTAPLLRRALQEGRTSQVLVLGAGSGGGIDDLVQLLPPEVTFHLSDLFPPKNFIASHPRVEYVKDPVDATAVPKAMKGVRLMQAIFHHLPAHLAQKVIDDTVAAEQPLLIFEFTDRSLPSVLGMLAVPFLTLFVMAKVRPLHWDHLVFTYLLPVIPLILLWDGIISALRTYTVEELQGMTRRHSLYNWEIRREALAGRMYLTYLYGRRK